eukprot:431400-Alexandrium_andersonii.AAC.1
MEHPILGGEITKAKLTKRAKRQLREQEHCAHRFRAFAMDAVQADPFFCWWDCGGVVAPSAPLLVW